MCPCVQDRIGFWKRWFLRRGEKRSSRRKTSRSKGENQQQTQPTYGVDAGIWIQRRVISPLRRRCLFLIFSLFSATGGENEGSSSSTALDWYVLSESSPLSDKSRFNLQSNLATYKTEGKDSVPALPQSIWLTSFKTYILKIDTYLVTFIVSGCVNFYTNLPGKRSFSFLSNENTFKLGNVTNVRLSFQWSL